MSPDDATCLAFGVDKQLSAGANATPPRCRMRWPTRLPGAQFAGKAAKVFSVVLGHTDGYPSQPARLRGTPLTHQRASRRVSAPTMISHSALSIARTVTPDATQETSATGENTLRDRERDREHVKVMTYKS